MANASSTPVNHGRRELATEIARVIRSHASNVARMRRVSEIITAELEGPRPASKPGTISINGRAFMIDGALTYERIVAMADMQGEPSVVIDFGDCNPLPQLPWRFALKPCSGIDPRPGTIVTVAYQHQVGDVPSPVADVARRLPPMGGGAGPG